MKGHPASYWSVTGATIQDMTSPDIPTKTALPIDSGSQYSEKALYSLNMKIFTPTVIVSRKALDEAGLFDPTLCYGEDYDLWFRLARVSKPAILPEPLALIRKYEDPFPSPPIEVSRHWIAIYDKHKDIKYKRLRHVIRNQRARFHARLGRLMIADSPMEGLRHFLAAVSVKPLKAEIWRQFLAAIVRALKS